MIKALRFKEINKLLWEIDPDYVAVQLVQEINYALDLIAPVKKTQLRTRYAPSISDQTKVLMKSRDDKKGKYLKTRTKEDKEDYTTMRNLVLAIQRKEKKT